jgi:His-Xaa-Ser repeat protein HxsA
MKLRYLIPSLMAAGFIPAKAVAVAVPARDQDNPNNSSLFDVFKQAHIYTLAGHSSHVSHASHASHSSSAGGGIYIAPQPRTLYTPPPSLYTVPTPAPLIPLKPTTDTAKMIVLKVQNALRLFGYDVPLDGQVGPATRTALLSFQTDWNLKTTGTITPQVLDALGVTAN